MADKLVTLPILDYFKSKTDETYVGKEAGKSLIEDLKVTKLDGIADNAQVNVIEKIEVDGVEQTIDETKKVTLDLSKYTTDEELTSKLQEFAGGADMESVLADYLKKAEIDTELEKYALDTEVASKLESYTTTEDLEQAYLKKEDIETTFENYTKDDELQALLESYAKTSAVEDLEKLLNKVGKLQDPTTKDQLATLKDTANKGDIFIVTDDQNHAYMYFDSAQASQNGLDENGFLDLGGHIDLSGIESELSNKATKEEVNAKVSNESFEAYKSEVESTYIKQADLAGNLVYCENTDIDAMFSPAE